jgi:hypothetical protein
MKVPMGDFANRLFKDKGSLSDSGHFYELTFNNDKDGRVALKDYELLVKYPNHVVTYDRDESTGLPFTYGGEKGDFEFTLNGNSEIQAGDHSVAVRRCQDKAWNSAKEAFEFNNGKIRSSVVIDQFEDHYCSEFRTLHFHVSEVCDEAIDWEPEAPSRFRLDKTKDVNKYTFKLNRLIKKGLKRDARQRGKEVESYLSANKDGDLKGYDFGVQKVNIELEEFYNTGLNKVRPEADILDFAKVAGFTSKDRKWMSDDMVRWDPETQAIELNNKYKDGDHIRDLPNGYYGFRVSLLANSCKHRDFCDYDIEVFHKTVYFFICDGED